MHWCLLGSDVGHLHHHACSAEPLRRPRCETLKFPSHGSVREVGQNLVNKPPESRAERSFSPTPEIPCLYLATEPGKPRGEPPLRSPVASRPLGGSPLRVCSERSGRRRSAASRRRGAHFHVGRLSPLTKDPLSSSNSCSLRLGSDRRRRQGPFTFSVSFCSSAPSHIY